MRNLFLAAGDCNTGVRNLDSGLPLDWASEMSFGTGEGWRASGPGGDPVFCEQNDTGGSGLSACVSNFFYATIEAQADLRVPFPAGGQSTATIRFLGTLTAGALIDRLEISAVLENQATHPLLSWDGNHVGEPVELDLNLLAPPYSASPPVELLFHHSTSSAGGQEGGYAQVDDVELVCGPLLFADDFDSGLTTHWSASTP